MEVTITKRGFMGDPVCGDQGAWWKVEGKTVFALADGLGHGPEAEQAARAALGYVAEHLGDPLEHLFAGCNAAIRKTRGVALAVAVFDPAAGELSFAGVGNIWGVVFTEGVTHLVSRYGIVGGRYRKLHVERVPFGEGSLLLLATDGVTERLDGNIPPGFRFRTLSSLGEELLNEWGREMDDAAILLCRT